MSHLQEYKLSTTIIIFIAAFFNRQSLATKFVVTLGYNLTQYIYIYILEMSFDKSTIRLHLLLISSIFKKLLEN